MKRWPSLLVLLALAGCGSSSDGSSSCGAVDRGELPSWATAGFSDPHPSAPHVGGRGGAITAVLFGDPLVAPPDKERSNKILWVARRPVNAPGALKIRARDGSRVVDRTLESGVGPSIVDLPAGCWTLDLRWSDGGHDSLMLRYAQGKPS